MLFRSVSLLRPEVIRDLDLARHGLEILPLDGTFTPLPDGDYLWRVNDHWQTFREISRHSRLDAEAYDEYGRAMLDMVRASLRSGLNVQNDCPAIARREEFLHVFPVPVWEKPRSRRWASFVLSRGYWSKPI